MTIGKREALRLERRANILSVAREVFFEQGYAATNMSMVAARLGGSKGTLWSYFPSKEALFSAVVEDTATAMRAQVDFSLDPEDPLRSLTKLARAMIERLMSPIGLTMFRLVNSEGARQSVGRIFYDLGPGRTEQMVAVLLEKLFAPQLNCTDYRQAARILFALITGGVYYEQIWGVSPPATPAQKDRDAARAATMFLRIYAKDPAPYVWDED
jgi:TetR/AcrR family transcriptional regulator, mexJK operon transcriptional repressor